MSGNPAPVLAGPGWLYVAAFGATEPTDATTPLGSGYQAIGYTEEGSTFTHTPTFEDLEVAEEVDPVKTFMTKRETMVSFSMAEATKRNLQLALNGGIAAPTTVVPPAPGAESYVSIVHESETGARWLFRKCIQTGSVEVAHKKAPNKTLIPVTFRLYLPGGGLELFEVFPDASGNV